MKLFLVTVVNATLCSWMSRALPFCSITLNGNCSHNNVIHVVCDLYVGTFSAELSVSCFMFVGFHAVSLGDISV